MSGNRLVLDTNAVIALLQGNPRVLDITSHADWIGISIITQIEFLCFSGMTSSDRELFERFVEKIEIVGLNSRDAELIQRIVQIRNGARLKLPDGIIAATALAHSAALVTADKQLSGVPDLDIRSFES